MILLLGATGYVGQAFARELQRRGTPFIPLGRQAIDYTQFDMLFDYVRKIQPTFLINAAGYVGYPTIDVCEVERHTCLQANAIFPQTIAKICRLTQTPWAHVSSANIYSGAKIIQHGYGRIERNIDSHEIRRIFRKHPENFYGFTELDEPNFTFRDGPCSFYSGSKAVAEEALRSFENIYIWRPGKIFDETNVPQNFLSRFQTSARITHRVNPLSHRYDFVKACLELWENSAPFGTYNVINPGVVTNECVAEVAAKIFRNDLPFDLIEEDETGDHGPTGALRPSCLLSAGKLLGIGVKMRSAAEALEESLMRWPSKISLSPLVLTPG